MPTVAEVLGHVFTTENPTTGSSPPAAMAWVIFSHGTCFFTAPTEALPVDASREAIEAAGRAALVELGPVIAGSPAADFSPTRLAGWYPDEPVWFVGFDHAAIATIIVQGSDELAAGLAARANRQADHDEPVVTLVRGFDGTVWA